MSRVFESGKIGGLVTANRFVRAATWEGLAAEDGSVTPQLLKRMTDLAEGGVGLIITSHCFVAPEGKASPAQIGMHTDALIAGHRKLTQAIHAAGGRIVAQISHAGNFADERSTGQAPFVASYFEGLAATPRREMTVEDIKATTASFAKAALRAMESGFDGVQIHAAHGFLLSQFLSPAYNRREDAYGGPIENRSRFLLEVYLAVREAVGRQFPALVKNQLRRLYRKRTDPGRLNRNDATSRRSGPGRGRGERGDADRKEALSGPPLDRQHRKGSLLPGRSPGLSQGDQDSPDPARRHPVFRIGEKTRPGRNRRFHLHEPAFHPGAGPGQSLEKRRPRPGPLHLGPEMHPGGQRGQRRVLQEFIISGTRHRVSRHKGKRVDGPAIGTKAFDEINTVQLETGGM